MVVLPGDWGEVAGRLTREHGALFAVLNMANAHGFGGGYVHGCAAQEENMFRRTDCHFSEPRDGLLAPPSAPGGPRHAYGPRATALLEAAGGRVYLDAAQARVCVRGREDRGAPDLGYRWLGRGEAFPFLELRAAAQDLRGGAPFDPRECRRRVDAQLATLEAAGVRHAVLSAFGCGAFENPAPEVAACYRAALLARPGAFDVVAFAVFDAGYGPDNLGPFRAALDGLELPTALPAPAALAALPAPVLPVAALPTALATAPPVPAAARPTTGERVVCVGDLHGCLAEAESLWRNLEAHLGGARQLAAATVVFLGDYVDRGPDSRGVLDWLVGLRAARDADGAAGGGTYFLCGNHDFAFGAFLGGGALPCRGGHTDADLDATAAGATAGGCFEDFYYDGEAAAALAEGDTEAGGAGGGRRVGGWASDGAAMHYQGRRWGGSPLYDADACFESYGAGPADGSPEARARLTAAVPAAHAAFVGGLDWCVDLATPFAPGRLVAVHAGLRPDRGAEAQIAALRARDFRDPILHSPAPGRRGGGGSSGRNTPTPVDPGRIEQLSGRVVVRGQHPDLAGGRCLLVSGHHHRVELEGDGGHRLVVDKAGGLPTKATPLQAVVLPTRELVSSSC